LLRRCTAKLLFHAFLIFSNGTAPGSSTNVLFSLHAHTSIHCMFEPLSPRTQQMSPTRWRSSVPVLAYHMVVTQVVSWPPCVGQCHSLRIGSALGDWISTISPSPLAYMGSILACGSRFSKHSRRPWNRPFREPPTQLRPHQHTAAPLRTHVRLQCKPCVRLAHLLDRGIRTRLTPSWRCYSTSTQLCVVTMRRNGPVEVCRPKKLSTTSSHYQR